MAGAVASILKHEATWSWLKAVRALQGGCAGALLAATLQAVEPGWCLEVDPENGESLVHLPMGPGIGIGPNASFRPALVGRLSPRWDGQLDSPVTSNGFSLSPGTLEWQNEGETSRVTWTYPDGQAGGVVSEFSQDPVQIMAGFGLALPPGSAAKGLRGTGGEQVVPVPGSATGPEGLDQVLVTREGKGYVYARTTMTKPLAPGRVAYRIQEIRGPGGCEVVFRHGANGIDYEAETTDARVRLSLVGFAATLPVPSLDDPGHCARTGTPAQAYRDTLAHFEVSYEGAVPGPRFRLAALVRTDHSALDPESLQIAEVEGPTPGQNLRMAYAKVEGKSAQEEPRCFLPTVLTGLTGPDERQLSLDWSAIGSTPSGVSCFGVHKVSAGNLRQIRLSRHFARMGPGEQSAPCLTLVRDRWDLAEPGGATHWATTPVFSNAAAHCPPGALTRFMPWAQDGVPPDLHIPPPGSLRGRLLGGSGKPPVTPGPISYNPARREVTMGAIMGPLPTGAGSGRIPAPPPSFPTFTPPTAASHMQAAQAAVQRGVVEGDRLRMQATTAVQRMSASPVGHSASARATEGHRQAQGPVVMTAVPSTGAAPVPAPTSGVTPAVFPPPHSGPIPMGPRGWPSGSFFLGGLIRAGRTHQEAVSILSRAALWGSLGGVAAGTISEVSLVKAAQQIARFGSAGLTEEARLLADWINRAITGAPLPAVDPNKVHHLFGNPDHRIAEVVKAYGSGEKAFLALQKATEEAARKGGWPGGIFEQAVALDQWRLTVRGAIMNGKVNIGTAFLPPEAP